MSKESTRGIVPNESNVFHVGEHLKDLLEYYEDEHGISQRQFAKLAGIQVSQLNEVLNGKRNISPLMALRIEKATGTPHNSWALLQWQYEVDKLLMKEGKPENEFKHDPSILESATHKESA